MNKFHSTITRRNFMKGLGLAGAGLGAAAATTPVFHDLDELTSAPGDLKHPWYVKELDHEKLSIEIDWSLIKRHDGTNYQRATEEASAIYSEASGKGGGSSTYRPAWVKEHNPDWKGATLRDAALSGAGSATRLPMYGSFGDDGHMGLIPTPNRIGRECSAPRISAPDVPWSGSPEEALRMLRQAIRFFSGFDVGCTEMTANTKKLIYQASGGKSYVWKNVTTAQVTDTELVIPEKAKYMIHFTTSEPTSQVRHAPASTYSGYDEYGRVVARTHYFLGRLGYQHIDMGGGTFAAPWGSLAGVAESGRGGKMLTSYRYGNMIRGQHRILTDLPIALTHPIDAGIVRFCESCKTCATLCPYQAMDLGDREWEHWHEPTNRLGAFIPGTKGWRTSILLCPKCKGCQGTCPFNSGDEAILHGIVRNVQGFTGVFNSFFADMHETFGFSTRSPEEWWEHDVPVGFYDPTFIKP